MREYCIVWILILLGAGAFGNYCKTDWNVTITNWTLFDNLTILDNEQQVLYSPEEYVKREVKNAVVYWGCLCDVKTCIRKCCPLGESLIGSVGCTQRQSNESDFKVNVTDTIKKRSYFVNQSSNFRWIYGFGGDTWYFLDPEQYPDDIYYINAIDGKLTTPYFRNKTYGLDEFCVDFFNQTNEYKVLIRSENSNIDASRRVTGVLYPVLMIISLPPLIITFIVYATIPELKNLHGHCLLSYVISLFFFYIFLALGHNGIYWLSEGACYFVGFSCIFWFHAVFFWLNAIGFDVCITFSNFRPIRGNLEEKEKKKFIYYSLYSWGSSSVFLIAALVIEFASNIPDNFVTPGIAIDRCWLANRNAELAFCYAPASILMICNFIMFIMTAFNFMKLNKEMSVMKKSGAGSNEDRRNRTILYMKLSIMMGINWILDVISWADGTDYWWYFVDVFNCLQGLFVFFIFVWSGKAKELAIKKFFPRYNSQNAVRAMKWKLKNESNQQQSTITGNTSSSSV